MWLDLVHWDVFLVACLRPSFWVVSSLGSIAFRPLLIFNCYFSLCWCHLSFILSDSLLESISLGDDLVLHIHHSLHSVTSGLFLNGRCNFYFFFRWRGPFITHSVESVEFLAHRSDGWRRRTPHINGLLLLKFLCLLMQELIFLADLFLKLFDPSAHDLGLGRPLL